MSEIPDKREPMLGWIFSGVMALHLLVLRPPSMVLLTAFAVLVISAVLRGRHIYAPAWLGRALLLVGVVGVILAQATFRAAPLLGEVAAAAGTLMLLGPITPRRAQRIVFCLLAMLLAVLLKPFPNVGTPFVIFDVAVLYLLTEQAYRPAEAAVSVWVSIARSFRVIVPVGIVVLGVFWLFPNFAPFTPRVFTGFNGGNFLNPGSISELSQSQREAFSAHFREDQALPPASGIYWRGQVLENNDGFRWSAPQREGVLQSVPPTDHRGLVRYTQELASNSGGVVPVLDHAVFVDAKRGGQDVAVFDRGAGVLAAVGPGALTMEVTASLERLGDQPRPEIAQGYLGVPASVRDSTVVREIVERVFPGQSDTPARLKELGRYFQTGGFHYSLRSGRSPDLATFLNVRKTGFCEHYATAAANLLRLAGIPTRVVAGFRGGEWNPWLRTITVRDSDAHAWVEAWDAASRRWLRFDPTDFVAPEIRLDIQREMDSSRWPWYRRNWSYGRALATEASSRIEEAWGRFTTSESWAYVPPALLISLLLVALIWLIRQVRARRAGGVRAHAARLFLALEQRAARLHRERKPGETPLAWLGRLEHSSGAPAEQEMLRHLATAYETTMYQAGEIRADLLSTLRRDARQLLKLWKQRPASGGS